MFMKSKIIENNKENIEKVIILENEYDFENKKKNLIKNLKSTISL